MLETIDIVCLPQDLWTLSIASLFPCDNEGLTSNHTLGEKDEVSLYLRIPDSCEAICLISSSAWI
jgi:hypothetical protein